MDISISFETYYTKALRFLSYRARSEKEVRDNLLKKKADPDVIDGVIALLKKQKFLNDEDFARLWIESRNRSKPTSIRLLMLELRRKGISDEIIKSCIKNQESEGVTDIQRAQKIVAIKFDKVKHLERNEIYKKIGGILARRGFSWDVIKNAIDDHLK